MPGGLAHGFMIRFGMLTVIGDPAPDVENDLRAESECRRRIARREQHHVRAHRTPEEMQQRPLRLVISVLRVHPRVYQLVEEILDGLEPGRTLRGSRRKQPERVALARELQQAQLAQKPRYNGDRGRGENQPARPSERAVRQPRQRILQVSRPRLLDCFQRIDEAEHDEEDRDGRVSLPDQP